MTEIPWDQSPAVIAVAVLFFLLRDAWKRYDGLLDLQNKVINILSSQNEKIERLIGEVRDLQESRIK